MLTKSPNSMSRQIILSMAVLGASLLIILILWLTSPEKSTERQPVAAVRVDPYTVRVQNLQPDTRITGRLQPANRALLRFETSGQVRQRQVEPGVKVTAGSELLSLQSDDAQDALIEATAKLDMEAAAIKRDRRLLDIAGRDVVLQQQEVKRLQQLDSDSLVSASRLDQAKQKLLQLQSSQAQLRYSVDTAGSRIDSAKAAQARTQRNLARTTLRAPFAGTVNTVSVETGDYVTPATVAAELVDLEYIDLYAEVAGAAAEALQLEQAVSVDVAGRQYDGRIIALRSDPDPKTFTHALRIRLDSQGLTPGTLASARLPLRELNNVLTVPVSSLLQEEGNSYVFVIEGSVLARRVVSTGIRDGEQIVVESGLRAGDRVVSRDVAALTDGQRIEVAE